MSGSEHISSVDDVQPYLLEWRGMEDRFYRSVLHESEMYMLGIRLVRAVAGSLELIDSFPALVARFGHSSVNDVIPVADGLGEPRVVLLDYQLALGAAFYLRAQEIREVQTDASLREQVDAARDQGREWVTLIDAETRRYGQSFFQKLEMRLSDGFGILTSSELDWEKGRIYVVEPLLLDPRSGRRRTGATRPEPTRECATLAEMQRTADDIRARYASSAPPASLGSD